MKSEEVYVRVPAFLRWFLNYRDAVSCVLTGLGGFLGSAALSAQLGAIQLVFLAVASAGMFMLAALLLYGARRLDQKQEVKKEQELTAQIESDDRWVSQIIEEFACANLKVAEELTDLRKNALSQNMRRTRNVILEMVRFNLGPSEGVRTCLFTPADNEYELQCSAQTGRGDAPSRRRFKPGDPTFDAAINRDGRWVYDVNAEDSGLVAGEKQSLGAYGNFATWPVSLDYELYGILTIDAKKPGDISGRDFDLLRAFASVLTLTLAVEPDARSIPCEPS